MTIQALRAYAALVVVVFHAYDAWGRIAANAPNFIAHWANGATGVDLFFVISGFVMVIASRSTTARPGSWRIFLARRLQRVVPLYWLATTLMLLMALLIPSLTAHNSPSLWNVIASYLFIPARDHQGVVLPVLTVGWTLSFEMFFYLLFALSLAFRVGPLRVLLPVLLPLAVLGAMRQPEWPAVSLLADSRILEFCLGVAVAQWAARGRIAGFGLSVGLIVAGILVLLLLPRFPTWEPVTWGVPAAAVLVGCISIERRLGPRLPGWLVEVGDASYAIYLLHPFVVPAVARVLAIARVPPMPALAAEIVGSLLISTAVGVLVHRQFERPIQQWFRRRRADAKLRAMTATPDVAADVTGTV